MSSRSEFDGLWSIYLPVALGVALLIWAALAYVIVRRHATRATPRGPDGMPRLELAVAGGLGLLVAALLVLTFRAESRVDASSGEPTTVRVLAYQWGWRFSYPGRHISVVGHDPTLAVPAGRPVHFELRSRDVIHAFWIPSARFKRDAIPGRTTSFDLTFDSPGVEAGLCAEYCGLGHDEMRFNVRVLEPAAFSSWLSAQRPRP